MDNPDELQAAMEQLRKDIAELHPTHLDSKVRVAAKQSELLVIAVQLAEIASRRLERHTKHLKYLTLALVIQTAVLLYFTFLLLQCP